MKNIKLVLEYDGTGFSGWQWQPYAKTLQAALEEAIKKISGEDIRVTASGRTDAGVHALGQCVSFKTDASLLAHNWQGALNHFLPDAICVVDAEEVDLEFNARFSAKGKHYRYVILNRPVPSPLMRNQAWHLPVRLDIDLMREAAVHFVGEQDFRSFCATDSSATTFVRELRRLEIDTDGERMLFSFEGSGFLKHMVRNIVGSLVEAGRGRFAPSAMRAVLDAKDRSKAGPTAPPQGLYLVRVDY